MVIRCPQCAGRKQLISLGNILKDCTKCLGVGHIKEELKKELPALDEKVPSITEIVEPKRASKKPVKKPKKSYKELIEAKKQLNSKL